MRNIENLNDWEYCPDINVYRFRLTDNYRDDGKVIGEFEIRTIIISCGSSIYDENYPATGYEALFHAKENNDGIVISRSRSILSCIDSCKKHLEKIISQ